MKKTFHNLNNYYCDDVLLNEYAMIVMSVIVAVKVNCNQYYFKDSHCLYY